VLAARAEPGDSPLAAIGSSLAFLALTVVFLRYAEPVLALIALVLVGLVWHRIAARRSVRYQTFLQRRAWRRAGVPGSRPLTVTLGTDWIWAKTRDNQVALRWRAIRHVLRGDGVIVITQHPRSPWLVIPEGSFASPEARDAFMQVIAGRRRAASEVDRVEPGTNPPGVEATGTDD
jgi:hypothetical protein